MFKTNRILYKPEQTFYVIFGQSNKDLELNIKPSFAKKNGIKDSYFSIKK